MNTGMRAFCAVAVFAAVAAGCRPQETREQAAERVDSAYRAAMENYSAGRIDQAIEGFRRVVRATPNNASARFQLGCLLQDARKDYLGAICEYREYLNLADKSDKAPLARDRAALCEQLLAPVLAKKMNLTDNVAIVQENEHLKERIEALTRQVTEMETKLRQVVARHETVVRENEGLRKLIPTADEEETTAAPSALAVTDRDLLDDEGETDDRLKISEDVKNLIVDEREESVETPYEVARRPQPKADVPVTNQTAKSDFPARPKTYTMQEGDTLTSVAQKFYGRKSAWRMIRDANKATVSTDGRVRAGQTIRLP